MKWDEFRDLLVGLGPDTPLGRIVAIRSEEDKEILKRFTAEQQRVRSAWRRRKAKEMTREQMEVVLEQLKDSFIRMAEGVR